MYDPDVEILLFASRKMVYDAVEKLVALVIFVHSY